MVAHKEVIPSWVKELLAVVGIVITMGSWGNSISNRVAVNETNIGNIDKKLDVIIGGQKDIDASIENMDTKINKNHVEALCQFYDLQLLISPKQAIDPATHKSEITQDIKP